MKTSIYLIRHGESENNIDNVLSGITDVPLSENGRRQCRLLSRFFADVRVDKVIASPLQRSIESAELIFPEFKSSLEIMESLIEINYGLYEGYSRNDYQETRDNIIYQWITTPSNLTFPGGDNIQEHARKAIKGIKKLEQENKGKIIACISHRTTIRLILAQILLQTLDNFRTIPCSNCGISEIYVEDSIKWKVKSINVTLDYLRLG